MSDLSWEGQDVAIITVGLMSLIGVLVTTWVTWITRREAREINRSVNNRPEGAPNLYELSIENHNRLGGLETEVSELKTDIRAIYDKVSTREDFDKSAKNDGPA